MVWGKERKEKDRTRGWEGGGRREEEECQQGFRGGQLRCSTCVIDHPPHK